MKITEADDKEFEDKDEFDSGQCPNCDETGINHEFANEYPPSEWGCEYVEYYSCPSCDLKYGIGFVNVPKAVKVFR